MKKLKDFTFKVPEKDKSKPIKASIYHHTTINGTLALPLLKMMNSELEMRSLADSYTFTHANYDVIFVEAFTSGGLRSLGFISYNFNQDSGIVYISGAYVLPGYRYSDIKFSIYDKMFDALKAQLQEYAPVQILSGVHIDNKAAQKAVERQGRKLMGYTYTYNLHKKD